MIDGNPNVKTGASPRPPAPTPSILGLERLPDPGAEQYGLIRLNRNERVQPLPESFLARIREQFTSDLLTGYPTSEELYRELAASLQIAQERLLLTSGSDGAVKSLYQTYLRPGDSVVMLDPSYAMYRVYAQMFQVDAVEIPFSRDLEIDHQLLVDSVSGDVRLVMLANPNQPTGTLVDESVILEVLDRAASIGALVAIDEAYFPFSSYTILPRIDQFPNLLVIRTFSKAAGLAGLRMGFVAGHPEVVANLWKVRSAHDVNTAAIVCAREILRSPEVVEDCVRQVIEGRRLLAGRVRTLGLEPLPTEANFMMIRVAHRCPPATLIEALRGLGYLVRGPFAAACVSECIRVTLGPPALMSEFADALEQALERVTVEGT